MIAFPNLKGYIHFTEMILKDTDLRFTEMITFPILKYNNHNTVTLCGNDCISDSQ